MPSLRSNKKITVIGSGFSGLSSSAVLAKNGFTVTVLEKNSQPGGRARIMSEKGFVFDMGPSWYWMPEVMERFFNLFGRSASDFFRLVRLDPSYQIIFGEDDVLRMPADYDELKEKFEEIEEGSGTKLDKFLAEAEYKYNTGMKEFVYKPSLRISEYFDRRILVSLFRLDMFKSFSSHVRSYFSNPKLIQALEFPVLFLGAMPSKTPALYSMMNYADMKLGTWYPIGGMHKLVEAMAHVAVENGAELRLIEPVMKITAKNGKVEKVITTISESNPDAVIAGADYHHVEKELLDENDRSYTEKYWNSKTLAPSCLIYYLGVNKKLSKLLHHNLFFDEDFDRHAISIYETKDWPERPLFYVCAPSVTDSTVAPEGMENLFILIPVAAGLNDTDEIRNEYFDKVISRLESFCGESISNHIILKKSYASSDFISDYNSYKGNAYGLANTLMQTAFMKPSIRSRKISNLYYTGQLTVPGPGVPPSIISGQVVANYVTSQITN